MVNLLSHVSLLCAAITNLFRYGFKSYIIMACLTLALFPILSGIAIHEGMKSQSRISLAERGDISLTMYSEGVNTSIPLNLLDKIKQIEGVKRVVPRIVGRAYIKHELVTFIGLRPEDLPKGVKCIEEGTKYKKEGEVVLGKGLASHLRKKLGDVLVTTDLHNASKWLKIVGILSPSSTIWSNNIILTRLDSMVDFFAHHGTVSDFQVFCKKGTCDVVVSRLKEINPLFLMTTKTQLSHMVDHAYKFQGGTFILLYLNAFAISLLIFLASSGFGLVERKREFGLLKACGWTNCNLLEMIGLEGTILGLVGTSAAILASRLLIKSLNGFFVGQLFISECGIVPIFPMPAEFSAIPSLACFAYATMLTSTGALLRVYKWLRTAPAEAMR